MSRFKHHIFICINVRPPGHAKGCCSEKGSEKIAELFKEELYRRGFKGIIRANKAGCLDACEFGPSVVIYPEGVWYGNVRTPEDVMEIIERHLIGGEVVERLRIPDEKFRR